MTKSTKTAKPHNMPWLSPYLIADDVDHLLSFCQKAFGFTPDERVKGDDGKTWHASMRYRDQVVMMGKINEAEAKNKKANFHSPKVSGVECPIGLYLYVDDVDVFYKHAVANGAKSIDAPQDMFWGDRVCRLQDPEGYLWSFGTFSGQSHHGDGCC